MAANPDDGIWHRHDECVGHGSVRAVTDAGYSFRVRAYEYDFNGDPLYSLSSTDTETTAAWPAAPTGLTATAVSDKEIDLSWTDNTTDSSTVYNVQRSADGITGWTTVTSTPLPYTSVSFPDTSTELTEGTPYYYRVWATNSGGDSAYTDVSNATTLPATPTSYSAAIVDGSQVNLTWTTIPSSKPATRSSNCSRMALRGRKSRRRTAGTGTMTAGGHRHVRPADHLQFPGEGV